MRGVWIRVWIGAGLLVAGLGGCASPQKIEDAAQRHEMRANELEARGDYRGAQSEREAAAKQRRKAAQRATTWW